MSSRKGGGKSSFSGPGGNYPSAKGKEIEGSGSAKNNPSIGQLNHGMADMSIDTTQEGEWECAKKHKNRGGGNAAKQRGSQSHVPKTWGHPDAVTKTGMATNGGTGKPHGKNWAQAVDCRRSAGRGNSKPQPSSKDWESAYMAPPQAVPPPLQHGWQWNARSGTSSSQPKVSEGGKNRNWAAPKGIPQVEPRGGDNTDLDTVPVESDDGSTGEDFVEDSDDDLSDEYDSDVSQKSHETRKKNKWFRTFFDSLDALTVEQINEPTRQWHCPACQDGPGAIDWYRGLQPLMTHAKTKGAKRVKLHRELAELLEEELQRKGTSVIPPGEVFGKWKGLREMTVDHEIVWPPMVVVMNTILEQDENDKWIGMGNQELLEYFQSYLAEKARHSYGPQGHRGVSVLIFEASAIGYMEAERLHKHFVDEGRDREAWQGRRVLFYPGGKRQLYGFLAHKEDLDYFNQHSHGKTKLKFEMRSYQEMVVGPMKQMNEDNQQLIWLKNKVAKQQLQSKTLEESLGMVTQKLRETVEENKIVRLRSKEQHEENKEEMDQQEHFFKKQMDKVHKATEEKERIFEKLLQEERAKARQAYIDTGTKEDQRLRKVEIAKIIDSQVKGVEEFLAERDRLVHAHEDKKVEMRRGHLEEEVNLEKEFDDALTKLMGKYAPGAFKDTDEA
uniref:Protein SUPPRESSOR OF GENE SILENCING 3 n=1 Tax=Anthurium amnicola TaxID=1678845 RepID=A0A1D1XZ20_9ARAE